VLASQNSKKSFSLFTAIDATYGNERRGTINIFTKILENIATVH